MANRIQLRRDTAANWTAQNPILGQGEPGFETDTRGFKVGTGTLPWNCLQYTGTVGYQGVQGATGTQGGQGYQGNQGYQGYQGNQGVQGVQGATGVQGFQGCQGNQGVQGNQGFQGYPSTIPGAQGYQGSSGAGGGTGAQGPVGATGATGAQGQTGATGATGAQGVPGNVGYCGSLSSNGWTKLPNGLIMQWGSISGASTPTRISFPIEFPNACFVVLGTNNQEHNGVTSSVFSWNTTSFGVDQTDYLSWMAIGN